MRKPPGYWTKERIVEVANTCKTRTEFSRKYVTAAIVARKMGWVDEVCAHMEALYDPADKIGNRVGYITITGVVNSKTSSGRKIKKYEYICDCGVTGLFTTSNFSVRKEKKFKSSCGCNNSGGRDRLLLNQSGVNTCCDCKQTLPISEFGENKSNYNGLQTYCRKCKSKRDQIFKKDPFNKEKLLIKNKEWYRLKVKGDPERYKKYLEECNERNKIRRGSDRVKNDPMHRAREATRKLVYNALKNKGVSKSKMCLRTEEILCCDLTYFKEYIESQFTEGMTWLNHGEWHLDHIIPMDAAETVDEVIKLNHWTNFQPLWSSDNHSKFYYILVEHHELFHKLLGREFDKEGGRVKN